MKLHRLVILASAFLCGLAGSEAARANVVVVDPAGGDGSGPLKHALQTAADGDIVLLRNGDYTLLVPNDRYVISGKGLTLTRDTGVPELTLPALLVSNIPFDRTVVVRGLKLGPSYPDAAAGLPGLEVLNSSGTVLAEDCALQGGVGSHPQLFNPFDTYHPAGEGLRATGSAGVVLTRCTVQGGMGSSFALGVGVFFYAMNGADGVLADASRVVLDHCTVHGGQFGSGQDSGFFIPINGAGLEAKNAAFVHCAGSAVIGGDTGGGAGTSTNTGEKSGNGLTVVDAASHVTQRDTSFTKGAVLHPTELPGVDISAPAGTLSVSNVPARLLTVTSPVREGETCTLSVEGQPGDLVMLLVALGAGFTPMPAHLGVFVEGPRSLLFMIGLGPTDVTGHLDLPFTTPDLIPGVMGLTLPLQAVVSSVSGATLESSSMLIWLDDSL